ncbi:MAG: peptidogalycan biosysnthesis protein, partial [Caulobacteraceae bacterium]
MRRAEATVRSHRRIEEIGREAWDACWRDSPPANPFVAYDFLDALEASGCVDPNTGWAPMHLELEGEDGSSAAVAPLYMKAHSQGEYVFDHAWADAYE